MALRISSESLEDRLASAPLSERDSLVNAFKNENIDEREPPHLKKDLVYRIVNYFRHKGVEFGKFDNNLRTDGYKNAYETLYNKFNKEPLKPVEYGTKLKGISTTFLSKISDFEKLYFLAGVAWYINNRKGPTNDIPSLKKLENEFHDALDYMDLHEIASIFIRDGIDVMNNKHNRIVEDLEKPMEVYRGNRREMYKNFWVPPRSKIIRRKLVKLQTVKQRIRERITLQKEFGQMYDGLESAISDDDYYTIHNDIDLFLGDLELDQRRFLTSYFGRERLGEYAVI